MKKIKRNKLIALICALYFHANTYAYKTGNDLYQAMAETNEDINVLYFVKGILGGSMLGYQIGKTGTVLSVSTEDVKHGMGICTDAGVGLGQSVDVIRKYLQETPERRHLDASFLVLIALRKAFPCNQ